MQWINLQLDMLPAIGIQIAKFIELYKNTIKEVESGHNHLAPKLKQLKIQLNKRVAQLDHFYKKFYFDERIHLFHRLKLQLKKVLHKHVQEIDNSYLQPQSLDVSKVREELALIQSTLEKQYQNNKLQEKPVVTVTNTKKSLSNSKAKPSVKHTKPRQVSKLNLDGIRAPQTKQTITQSRSKQPTESKRKTSTIPSNQPSSRPSQPQPKKPQVPMQQLVFTIKMTKEQYLQFLQAKKGN